MDKHTVFLTGATGNMGWAGFQELYKKKGQVQSPYSCPPEQGKQKEAQTIYG